jgi:hypothetical protein
MATAAGAVGCELEIRLGGCILCRMNLRRTAITLLLAFASGTLLGRRLVRYAPAVTELRGRLQLAYFPGPPNYESIKGGDERQTAYLLELEEPFDITTANNPRKPLRDPEGWGRNVKRIQLADDGTLKGHVGKQVTVKGKLLEAVFGHHHTSVLMEDLEITEE